MQFNRLLLFFHYYYYSQSVEILSLLLFLWLWLTITMKWWLWQKENNIDPISYLHFLFIMSCDFFSLSFPLPSLSLSLSPSFVCLLSLIFFLMEEGGRIVFISMHIYDFFFLEFILNHFLLGNVTLKSKWLWTHFDDDFDDAFN